MPDYAPRFYVENTPVTTILYRGAERRVKIVYTTFINGAWYAGCKSPDDRNLHDLLLSDIQIPGADGVPVPPPPPADVRPTVAELEALRDDRIRSENILPPGMTNTRGPAYGLAGARIMQDDTLDQLNRSLGFPSSVPRGPTVMNGKHVVSIAGDGRHEITIDGVKHTITSAELRAVCSNQLLTMTLEQIAAVIVLRQAFQSA